MWFLKLENKGCKLATDVTDVAELTWRVDYGK